MVMIYRRNIEKSRITIVCRYYLAMKIVFLNANRANISVKNATI